MSGLTGSTSAYPIGYFHIDIAEVRTEEGKLYLFVAIDRTARFAFVALHEKSDRPTAARFLGDLISAVPYRVHTVLTDNGLQFTDLPRIRNGQIARHPEPSCSRLASADFDQSGLKQ